MTLVLVESSFTYRSDAGGQSYFFTVVSNMNGVKGVRDEIGPTGPIQAGEQVPEQVVCDEKDAIGQVTSLLAQTSAVNGILTFTAETSQSVAFAVPFANTNYRVHLEPQDPVFFWVSNKTVTGFTINASITFSGMVGFDVFV